MPKNKRYKWKCGIFIILILVLHFEQTQTAKAELGNVSDTISTSAPSAAADHEILFTTGQDVGAGGYFEITLAADFGDVEQAVCAGPNETISTTSDTVRCTYSLAPGATSTKILILGLDNPAAIGFYHFNIRTYNSGSSLLEEIEAGIFISDSQTVHAWVGSIISFALADELDVSAINGVLVTGSSTATELFFGDLTPGASSTLGHKLTVETNAENGYSLTVAQSGEMVNQAGDTINSFDNAPDGFGSTTPHAWNPSDNIFTDDFTHGHIGLTTDDATLSALDFSGSKYVGLDGAEPVEVMYHDTRTTGQVLGQSLAHVAYTIEVGAYQQAGTYTNTLSYVCTGTF